MLEVTKKENQLQEEGLIDPTTDELTWKTFIPEDKSDDVYQMSDDLVIGVGTKDRRLRKDEAQVIFYGIS